MCEYKEDKPCCYFHPKEAFVGVCPWCLNERLVILASKQIHLRRSQSFSCRRKPQITLPKVFAFPSFLTRFEFRPRKSHNYHTDADADADASTSQEDSFISIKFENNEVATWEKGKVSEVFLDNCSMPWTHHQDIDNKAKTVVEHAKPRGSSLRWRKRIGQLFQVVRWKRSSVGSKLEGVKVRHGWISTLTKRRAKK